ncbi:MAG: DnaD domain protein [Lachnospiraceae bacterium]|nr:DnaD domain protein [Lachnospiraceae bacterium]
MDSSITLSYGSRTTSTMVSNIFIDRYMTDARGSDVKVYIYLLRCLQDPSTPVSIESIAEALDETEKDIKTALKYWKGQHVLSVHCSRDGKIKNITLFDLDEDTDEDGDSDTFEDDSNITIISDVNKKGTRRAKPPVQDEADEPDPEPKPYARRSAVSEKKAVTEEAIPVSVSDEAGIVKPNYSSKMIQGFKNDYPEFDELIDYIENALGKTLSQRDLQTPSFIFEGLGFSADLICFLYDYCIGKNKRTASYIEKVAREWHAKGIQSVEDAMTEVEEFNNRYSAVKNAFGINRNFGEAELKYIKRWYHEYRFSDEMISLACDKTLINTSKPRFDYADSILRDWHKKGITTSEEAASSSVDYKASTENSTYRRGIKNSSLQYSQRTYSDAEISAIEKKKLGIL